MAFPSSLVFEDKHVSLWKFEQLEQLAKGILKNRCNDLETKVGKDRLPPRSGHGQDTLIRWILDVQVMLAAACGMPITLAEFGMPRGFGEAEQHMFGDQSAPAKASNFEAPASTNGDSALMESYIASRQAAAASKAKSRGSCIF